MNKLYFLCCILFSLCFSSECFQIWHSNFSKDRSNESIYKVSAMINSSSLDSMPISLIFDEKRRAKIEYGNQVLLFLEDKSMKLFKETNQLYIDNPDSIIFKIISSIFYNVVEKEKFLKLSNTKYSYNLNNSNIQSIIIEYDSSCKSINKIEVSEIQESVYVEDISIDHIINNNDIFNINGNYFIYDLRR